MRGHIRTGEHHLFALTIDDAHGRTQIFACSGSILRIQYRDISKTRQLIRLPVDGKTFFHRVECNRTRHFRHDRVRVRVPL